MLNLIPRAVTSSVRERLTGLLVAVMLGSLSQVVTPTASQATTVSATSCSTYVAGKAAGGVSVGGSMKILPLHGKGFYLDLKNGFNASYIGYKITNSTGATIDDLWLEVGNFRDASNGSSVLSLVNPADAYQPIGRLTNGSSKVIYVLVKGSAVSTVKQRHDVFIHKGYPRGDGSLFNATSSCYYEFEKVLRTLAASANKVTSISVSTTAPIIGDSVVVTVQGNPGQSGSGSTSPDGDVMWLSGASSSLWPTRALRLEKTSIDIQWGRSKTVDSFADELLITDVTDGRTGNSRFTNKSRYTATFTFRVLGGTTTNPIVKPVAHIASGTQIKHTGTYPSVNTTIATSQVVLNMKAVKAVETITALAGTSDTWIVNYRVTITDTRTAMNLDYIVDDPDAGASYVTSSARITDSTRTTPTAITDPVNQGTVADPKYVFPGPFSGRLVSGTYTVILTYEMHIPRNKTASPVVFKNRAYGLVGPTLVGSTSSTVSVGEITLPANDGTPTKQTINEAKPKQPQEIDFPAIPSIGVNQTYTLDAVASSGLPVSYTSSTPSACSVDENILLILTTDTCTVVASQPGNTDWDPASNVTRSVVPKLGQVITFTVTSPMNIGSSQTDSTTSSSGLPVTTEVISVDICKLVVAGVETTTSTGVNVTIRGKTSGACVVVATQDGDSSFAAAVPVERTINIGEYQYIDFTILTSPQSNTGSKTGTISAVPRDINGNVVTENLNVDFVSQTPDVCTIGSTANSYSFDAATKITEEDVVWTKEGLCVITASQDGYRSDETVSLKYAPAVDVTKSFTIGNKVPSLLVVPSLLTVPSGDSQTVSVRLTLPTWASGTRSVAGALSLFVNGRVAINSEIQTTTLANGSPTSGQTISTSFWVEAGRLAAGTPSELMNLTAQFVTSNTDFLSTSTPSETSVTVTSPVLPEAATGDVASVDVGPETATVRGTHTPMSGSNATATILFGLSSTSLTDTVTINSGTVTGTGNSPLSVSGLKSGLTSATRYFYQVSTDRGGDKAYGAIKAFVTRPPTPTGFDSTSVQSGRIVFVVNPITPGSDVTISYTITCTSGGTSVSTSGSGTNVGGKLEFTLSGLAPNTAYDCQIYATSSGQNAGGGGAGAPAALNGITTTIAKTARGISISGRDSQSVVSNSLSIFYGDTVPVTAAISDSLGATVTRGANPEGDGDISFTFASGTNCSRAQSATDSTTATISTDGIGTCALKVSIAETVNFSETSSANSVTVIVSKRPLTVLAPSQTLTYGDPIPTGLTPTSVTGFVFGQTASSGANQAAGYVSPSCSTTYTPDSPTTVTPAVTCEGGSADNYNFSVFTPGTITILKATPVASFTSSPTNMTSGDPDQTINDANNKGLTNQITVGPASVCELQAGKIRAVGNGTCEITAQSAVTTNFNPSNLATETLTVSGFTSNNNGGGNNGGNNNGGGNTGPSKLNPTITWEDPNDIFNPTPLGATQLNAVGSVPGTLVYTPAAGTVLAVGRHTLSVTLNPTDATTYNSVSTTVQIRVLEQRFQTVLTWSNPASIVYPTPLSRIQLNARANTPGTFTYDPAIGTVLNPGTHILSVDFQPTLSRTYQPASTQVTIVVTTSGGSTPATPTPQQPIVVDTRPATTPSNPNQGGGGTSGNPGGPNNPGNSTPPGQSRPVIRIDTTTVNSVTITDKGPGVTDAQVRTDRVDIVTAPTFSGKTSVEVTYVQNNETKVVVVPLVIPPAPPANAGSSPQSMERSTIKWAASPNAISYDVYVRESLECQVRTTSCEVPFIVGPATPIRVVAIGGDETKAEVAPVFKQERVIPALTVNFATASSRLSAAFREELREIAEIVEREGFTSLIVYGHTDSRSYDNRTLSRQRAEATRDFLKRLLPDVEFKIAGFAATQRVAAENTRAGLAQNRRAEVRIAG